MPMAWKEWQGRVVNKEFRLGEFLGGSERAGVFVTQYGPESLKAAVKLIPVGSWDQAMPEAEIARLQSARGLSHPHLLQILEAGRTTLDDSDIIFVVMEYADEDLSQILPNRPLTGGEIREMLGPALEALSYLHGKGFAHGRLKPANVMAIGDQLKLSSDGISAIGQRRWTQQGRSEYDAPETEQSESLAASDVWSLGMLLVVALTQHLPGWDASGKQVLLPTDLPAPSDDIARHCLQRYPQDRCSVADIAARLGLRLAAQTVSETVAAKAGVPPAPTPRRSAAAPQSAAPTRIPTPQQRIPTPQSFPYKRRSNAGPYVAVAAVLLIVGILVVPRLFRNGRINSQAVSLAADSTTEPDATAPAKTSRAVGSDAVQAREQGASGDGAAGANLRASREEVERPAATRAKTSRRGLTAGQVAEQVVPEVPQSARDTIRGTVRVGVRLSVDTAGNVTEAELDNPGPSKYFARLALEAAQQWKFEPPKMQGQNVLSDWLLHFQFTGNGTKVVPVQADP
jgi:eukaryotic-like serine/threonine-protein kinase